MAALLLCGCNEELVLQISTRVYPDGSVSRRLDLNGRDEEGKAPTDAAWLEAQAGVTLAQPERWRRVERQPGRISAEGVWPAVGDMPSCLQHPARESLPAAEDRCSTRLDVDDLVILKRYRYEERWDDPFGAEGTRKAVDRMIDLAVEALSGELKRLFGGDFDTTGAEQFLRGEGRLLLEEEIAVSRQVARRPEPMRRAAWSEVLRRHGVTVVSSKGAKYWQKQSPAILDWLRVRIAVALSTAERRVAPEELTFWPSGEEPEESAREIVRRNFPDEARFEKELEGLLTALQGWYPSSGGRYRFHSRVVLPGKILFTNGTIEGPEEVSDGPASARLFRGEDLATGDVFLRVTSVALDDEALRGLGARRTLDSRHLVEVVDLLTERDPAGLLREALRRAVRKGGLDELRSDDSLPPDVLRLARELADQLDPAVPPPFG